jgi:hypothetical protein
MRMSNVATSSIIGVAMRPSPGTRLGFYEIGDALGRFLPPSSHNEGFGGPSCIAIATEGACS